MFLVVSVASFKASLYERSSGVFVYSVSCSLLEWELVSSSIDPCSWSLFAETVMSSLGYLFQEDYGFFSVTVTLDNSLFSSVCTSWLLGGRPGILTTLSYLMLSLYYAIRLFRLVHYLRWSSSV